MAPAILSHIAALAHMAALAVLALAATSLHADEPAAAGWRCAAPTATAYRRAGGGQAGRNGRRERWETVVFPVTGQRFLVRPASAGHYELVHEVDPPRVVACTAGFDEAGWLRCGDGDAFTMNRRTLVFTSHLFEDEAEGLGDLTAATVTGSCRPL